MSLNNTKLKLISTCRRCHNSFCELELDSILAGRVAGILAQGGTLEQNALPRAIVIAVENNKD